MNLELLKQELNKSIEAHGYIFDLRYRNFSYEKGEQFVFTLQQIDFKASNCLDKELVKLIWYIPQFLEWRKLDFQETKVLSEEDFSKMEF